MDERQHISLRPKLTPCRPASSRSSTKSTESNKSNKSNTTASGQQNTKRVRFESRPEDESVSPSAQPKRCINQKAPPPLKTAPLRTVQHYHSHVNATKVPPPCPEVPIARALQQPRTRRPRSSPRTEQAEELPKDSGSQHHPQPRYYRTQDARETDEAPTLRRADDQIKAYYGYQS